MSDNLAYQYRDERRKALIGGEAVLMAPSPVWGHVSIPPTGPPRFIGWTRANMSPARHLHAALRLGFVTDGG